MALPGSNYFAAELPKHCTPTTEILARFSAYFGVCVPTPQTAISTALGCMSILSWLCAQMPQLVKNYKLKSTAGLSLFFIGEWLAGDITNLVGAVLTHQAGWQITVASYYVFVDTCLLIQYLWYSYMRSRFDDGSIHSETSTLGDMDEEIFNSLSPINSNFASDQDIVTKNDDSDQTKSTTSRPLNTPQFRSVSYEKNKSSSPLAVPPSNKEAKFWLATPSPRTFAHAATLSTLVSRAAAAPVSYAGNNNVLTSFVVQEQTSAEFIGVIIAWSSTLLYLGSRLPQIYKNWSLQSTAGLSPFLFIAAFCGNAFYTTSMATNPSAWGDYHPYGNHGWVGPDGSERKEWLANAAPFFLGAFGCLGMDVMIGVQFLMYGEPAEKVVKVRDGRGGSHWERVSGWMRGWVPTLSREKVVDLAESQRLLSESREQERRTIRTSTYNTL